MSLKLLKSYLTVARYKFETQRYDEALADYSSAYDLLSDLGKQKNCQISPIGILVPLNIMECSEEESEILNELFLLSLTRAKEGAECLLARGSKKDLQNAKIIFEFFCHENSHAPRSLLGVSYPDMNYCLMKTQYRLGLYQEVYQAITSPFIEHKDDYNYNLLRADIYVEFNRLEEALEIYHSLFRFDESKKPINADMIVSKMNNVKTRINLQKESLEFCVYVDEFDQKCEHKSCYQLRSEKESLQEIKTLLTKNPNLRYLKLVMPKYNEELVDEHELDRPHQDGTYSEVRVGLRISAAIKIIQLLKFNNTLYEFSISGCHVAKRHRVQLVKEIAVVLTPKNKKDLTFNQSLLAINIDFERGNLTQGSEEFWNQRAIVIGLLNRNLTTLTHKLRIYPCYVMFTLGMQVNRGQNWDRLVGLMLTWHEDPAQPFIKKYLRDPATKIPLLGGNPLQNDFAFCCERTLKQIQEPAKEQKSLEQKSSALQQDKCHKFTTSDWRNRFFTGMKTKKSKWKLNVNVKWLNDFRFASQQQSLVFAAQLQASVPERDENGEAVKRANLLKRDGMFSMDSMSQSSSLESKSFEDQYWFELSELERSESSSSNQNILPDFLNI